MGESRDPKQRLSLQVRWFYSAVAECLYRPEFGSYRAYGIRVEGGGEFYVVHDISTRRQLVDRMVFLFNRCWLYPVHLREVIEDMLP